MLLYAAAGTLLLLTCAEANVGHVTSKVPIYLLDLGDGPMHGLGQFFAITDTVVKYINDMETILPAYELKVIHYDTEVSKSLSHKLVSLAFAFSDSIFIEKKNNKNYHIVSHFIIIIAIFPPRDNASYRKWTL